MLFVLPWICFIIAAAALAELIREYKKEEEMFNNDGSDQEVIYNISA